MLHNKIQQNTFRGNRSLLLLAVSALSTAAAVSGDCLRCLAQCEVDLYNGTHLSVTCDECPIGTLHSCAPIKDQFGHIVSVECLCIDDPRI